MGWIVDTLTRKNKAQRFIVAIVIYGIVALFMFLFSRGIQTNVDELLAENARLEEQRQEYHHRAENKDRFEQEVDQLNEDFSQALQELPDSSEINELLRRISTIGKKIEPILPASFIQNFCLKIQKPLHFPLGITGRN